MLRVCFGGSRGWVSCPLNAPLFEDSSRGGRFTSPSLQHTGAGTCLAWMRHCYPPTERREVFRQTDAVPHRFNKTLNRVIASAVGGSSLGRPQFAGTALHFKGMPRFQRGVRRVCSRLLPYCTGCRQHHQAFFTGCRRVDTVTICGHTWHGTVDRISPQDGPFSRLQTHLPLVGGRLSAAPALPHPSGCSAGLRLLSVWTAYPPLGRLIGGSPNIRVVPIRDWRAIIGRILGIPKRFVPDQGAWMTHITGIKHGSATAAMG